MRKPGFWEEDHLSFLLQLGCEELTASCKMRWLSSLPLWNSRTGRTVLPLSVRKLPPGAWIYSSKLCRMWVIEHLGRKNLGFCFFFSFTLDIGLFSLAFKDLDNIPLQIFPISTMSFRKPSPLMEDNTVPAGG